MFTGSQIRAGAALASETLFRHPPSAGIPSRSLYAMAFIIIAYTVMGGIKAVIYTDFAQWLVLLGGLIHLRHPPRAACVGNWSALRTSPPCRPDFLAHQHHRRRIHQLDGRHVPIWLVLARPLCQRMYACKGVKEAAAPGTSPDSSSIPSWPSPASFSAACARALYPELVGVDGGQESACRASSTVSLGVTGIVAAAYFSAIMSTADSCLMASSGNLVGDLLHRYLLKNASQKSLIRWSQGVTLALGLLAIAYARRFGTVIEGVFDAYGFLVAGTVRPHPRRFLLAAIHLVRRPLGHAGRRRLHPAPAPASGPSALGPRDLFLRPRTHPRCLWHGPLRRRVCLGLPVHAAVRAARRGRGSATRPMTDALVQFGGSTLQHGPNSRRVYLMKLDPADLPGLHDEIERLVRDNAYGKVFAKVPEPAADSFLERGTAGKPGSRLFQRRNRCPHQPAGSPTPTAPWTATRKQPAPS